MQATHLQLHQPVAIKVLLPELLGDQQVVQRFLREGQAAVRLRGEHVARVIDVGTLETGAPYMVLEYLEGTDLARLPRSHLSAGAVVDLILQACEALAEAHALGIVHRDIKPASLFITRRADGTPLLKVLDFGISRMKAAGVQLTTTQTVMGTPVYMSPEQMRSPHDVDHRGDIWSLGVVLYELLEGAPPFGSDTLPSMILRIVNDPLPKLTVPLPGNLDQVVYRCLEKHPARRFQSTAELARALAKYAQSEIQAALSVQRTQGILGMEHPRAAPGPSPTQPVPSSTLSGSAGASATLQRSMRRRAGLEVIVVLAGILLIAVIGVRGSRSNEDRASPAGAQPPAVVTAPPTLTRSAAPGSDPAEAAPPAPALVPDRPNGPAAAVQIAPQPPSAASTEPTAAAVPPSMTTKKPRRPTRAPASSAKAGSPPAKLAPPDDDVLGKRK